MNLLILALLAQSIPFPGPGMSHSAGGTPTWSLVQAKWYDSTGSGTGGSSCSAGTSSCTVTVSSTGAGHLLVAITAFSDASTRSLSSVSGGETWTHCAGTNGCNFGTSPLWTDASYVLSAAGGATALTCNLSSAASDYIACIVLEYAWSGSTITFDTSNGGSDNYCTSCAGQALTIGGSKDVIIQVGVPLNSLTAITGSYTTPGLFHGAAVAGMINTNDGTAPTWTQDSSGLVAIMAIAFSGS